MKKLFFNIICILSVCLFTACDDKVETDYTPTTSIIFDDAVDNQVTVLSGKTSYLVSGMIKSQIPLLAYSIYTADPKSGAALTEVYRKDYDPVTESVMDTDFAWQIDNITSNQAIQLQVMDKDGGLFVSNVVVKVTVKVIFTDKKSIESADYYYGMYMATWYNGRVYPQREVEKHAGQVDISMGYSVNGSDSTICFMSPAARGSANLSFTGAKATKFAVSPLSPAEFEQIVPTDDSALSGLVANLDNVMVEAGKVYNFLTAEGAKGVIYVDTYAESKPTSKITGKKYRLGTAQIRVKVQNK